MSAPAPSLQAVQVVGGVVPPGMLARLRAGELGGLSPAFYHLAGQETIRDAASRAWSYLRGAWTAWRDHTRAQPAGTPGTGAARERWLLVLLRELGYGQLPALLHGYEIDGQDYPVSHTWQHVPIHLLGPGVQLDHRNPGVAGAARAPQAMLQELLNRSGEQLWAILANGLRLRLLRDSTALAGSAYLEFDLEAIFDGELYPEFLLLWQMCHVSRVEKRGGPDAPPADCWLEAWRGEAVETGTRFLGQLRHGVQRALEVLGTGFLCHPDNRALVTALRQGRLSAVQYHRALLRLAYRLLFCFVAEDRDALLHPAAPAPARERYQRYFSTTRLRELSRKRSGGPHGDLWLAQRLVLRALGDHGHEGLGLPALAGLFDPDPRLPVVDETGPDLLLGCSLSNHDLLAAIRQLGWVAPPGQRVQRVDYRNLGAEELGSVYESLLELVPDPDLDDQTFRLVTVAGNERKTSGSFYTPAGLVSALLDTALDPLLNEATRGASSPADAARRLLAITVCDPACGSGHFLVAAARRIARRVAQARCGEDEPTPAEIQHALRDVVGRCVYGVDLNDLAAELAKVSLWLEALEPGKPLGFLDARLRVGDSLLGTTPALLERGVPDTAFKELPGDERDFAAAIRRRNRKGRGQDLLFVGEADPSNVPLAQQRAAVLQLPDDVDEVRAQERSWHEYEESTGYLSRTRYADAWCAAFVWPLWKDAAEPPIDAVLRAIKTDPLDPGLAPTLAEVERLATEYRFFHWHLEFPEIFQVNGAGSVGDAGWSGGFTCLLGNPPWERVKLQEQEFFADRHPDIATAPNAAARKQRIAALAESELTADRALFDEWMAAQRFANGVSMFVRESGRYPLTATGDINTYAVFAETARMLLHPEGRLGIIVPTGIATDSTTQRFFRSLVEGRRLDSLLDFVTNPKLWTDVGNRRYRFSLLCVVGAGQQVEEAEFTTLLKDPADLPPRGQRIRVSPEDLLLVNPNTGTCPMFVNQRDAEITVKIYRRVPVLWRDGADDGNPWGLSFMAMLHMANDSGAFHTAEKLEADGWSRHGNLYHRHDQRMRPLYEAKLVHQFDHRLACYSKRPEGSQDTELPRLTEAEKRDPDRVPIPRYWVAAGLVEEKLAPDPEKGKPGWDRDWLLGWRDITNATNERTVIATVLPRVGVGHKFLLALPEVTTPGLQANLCAFVLDYTARQKLSGTSMSYFVLKQLPVLPPGAYRGAAQWDPSGQDLDAWVSTRVLELTYTSYDIAGYARDVGDDGPPFVWDSERRALLRAELDAAYFHLYRLDRDEVEYVMDTFRGVRRHDETAYQEYRTKRLILEVYDAMRKAIDTALPYQTILDPPPGQGPRHPARTDSR
jgi:hypothetical protein